MTSRLCLPQGTIAYRATGPPDSRLPPVVFVHGLLVDGGLWRGVADGLARYGIRSYAPDWPLGSHQIPMRADADLSPKGVASIINAFVRALDLREVTLVGSDTGGALCQFAVDSDASRIGRLVLTNCDAFDVFPPREFEGLIAAGRSPLLLKVLAGALLPTALRHSRWGYGLTFASAPDPAITRSWITPMWNDGAIRRDASKLMSAMRPAELLDVSTRFSTFTKPVHIVWGDADRYFDLDFGKRLAAAFPNSTFTTIRGGRTFVPMEFPEQVANAIRQTLQPHR